MQISRGVTGQEERKEGRNGLSVVIAVMNRIVVNNRALEIYQLQVLRIRAEKTRTSKGI